MDKSDLLDKILELRHINTILSNFINVDISKDSRLHTSFSLVETGRLSSHEDELGKGMHLQNIPGSSQSSSEEEVKFHTNVRKIFIADEGKVLIEADKKQGEAMIVAWLASELRMKEVFKSGGDIHRKNAGYIFRKSEDSVTSNERYLAKRMVHACCDNKTNVLTPQGWIEIDKVKQGDFIAQWDIDSFRITFGPVIRTHAYEYKDKMFSFEGQAYSQFVTPTHIIPYVTNKNLKETFAMNVGKVKDARFPICGFYSGGVKLSDTEIRLIAAIQADATIKDYDVVWHLKKGRKIERLCYLLQGLNFHLYHNSDETVNVVVRKEVVKKSLYWLDEKKRFNFKLLMLNANTLDTLLDEVSLWDGYRKISTNSKRIEYFSSIKENVDWIQTIAHLRGKESLVHFRDRRIYTASLNERKFVRIPKIQEVYMNGYVYCVTVPYHFFLIKRNGKISVTGNSNYGMGSNTMAAYCGMSRNEAQVAQKRYFEAFPNILSWQAKVRKEVKKTRVLTNPFGRRRVFFDRMGEDLFREAYAFVPQSTLVDDVNKGLIELFYKGEPRLEILTQTHDSVLVQVKLEDVSWAIKLMKDCLEQPFLCGGELLTVPVEIKAGENWGEMKNPSIVAI